MKYYVRLCATIISLAIVSSAVAFDLTSLADYDGDGQGDVVLFESSTNAYTAYSPITKKFIRRIFGSAGSVPLPGQFNNDRVADFLSYVPASGTWQLRQSDGYKFDYRFGGRAYLPVPGHYSSAQCTDMALFYRKAGKWVIRNCKTGQRTEFTMGAGGLPVPGDYDCDGRTDIAVFDRIYNNWKMILSSTGQFVWFKFGRAGDWPVPADYNGDSCTEAAVYRFDGANFYVAKPRITSGIAPLLTYKQWGLPGDLPFTLSVDTDKKADFAIYRPAENYVHVSTSTGKYLPINFGSKLTNSFGDDDYGSPDGEDDWESYEEMYIAGLAEEFCIKGSSETRDAFVSRCAALLQHIESEECDPAYTEDGECDGFDNATLMSVLNRMYPRDTTSQPSNWTSSTLPFDTNRSPVPVSMNPTLNAVVPGDTDHDARTNLILINENYDTLNWTMINPGGARTTFALGYADNDAVIGDYDGDGRSEPVVINLNSTNESTYEWRVRTSVGSKQYLDSWGRKGDKVVVGDLDCDRVTDKIVVRNVNKQLRWYVKFSSNATLLGRVFGAENANAFAADINGDGCDEMVISQKDGNEISWFYTPYNSSSVTRIRWGLKGDRSLKPYDMDGDSRADLIVVRNVGYSREFYVRITGTTRTYRVPLGSSAEVALVGNYTSPTIADVAVYNASTGVLTTKNIGMRSSVIAGPRGTVMPADLTRPVNSDVGDNTDLFGCDVIDDFEDGNDGNVLKPYAEGGSCGGRVTILLQSRFRSVGSIDILGSEAQLLQRAGKTRDYGNRPVYDTCTMASWFSNFNPLMIRVRLNNVNYCFRVEDAGERQD